jgi:hypothetical protein
MTFVLPRTFDAATGELTSPELTSPVTRRANMIGQEHILDLIETYVPSSMKVRSFDNKHSPITQQSIETLARHEGWQTERVYDAAHGRRYILFVFPGDANYVGIRPNPHRTACYDFLCAPTAS